MVTFELAHEIHQYRLQQAEQERLYRQVTAGAPSLPQRLLRRGRELIALGLHTNQSFSESIYNQESQA